MKCDCYICNPEYDPFEQYLHWKRWTSKEDEDNFVGLTITDMSEFRNYLKGWIEGAVHSIKHCEEQNPAWKKLGDKEREEFWKK